MVYSKLSDFEINKKVLAIRSGLEPLSYPHDADKVSVGVRDKNDVYHWYAFCNSWADAGPIIEKYGIGLRRQSNGVWVATQPGGAYPQYGESPLRIAMIVYLMMNDKGEGL